MSDKLGQYSQKCCQYSTYCIRQFFHAKQVALQLEECHFYLTFSSPCEQQQKDGFLDP